MPPYPQVFPIHQQLLTLLRTLDPFSPPQLRNLQAVLTLIVAEETVSGLTFLQGLHMQNPEVTLYLQVLIKLHQVLTLVNVDFTKLLTDKPQHAKDILSFLQTHDGLDFSPRVRSIQGRSFEHALESRSLLLHLKQVEADPTVTLQPKLFTISCDKLQEHDLYLKKECVSLTISAQGKADLYFNAFFWTTYCKMLNYQPLLQCSEIQRLISLSGRPRQVIDKIKKYPFGEAEYNNLVISFASLNPGQKNCAELIAYIQTCLFVAQITDSKDSLQWLEKLLIQLLGFHDAYCRDSAVVLLNSLYDGVDWQQQGALRPVIRCIGQHFKVNLKVTQHDAQMFLGLIAPPSYPEASDRVLTWHKIEQHNIVATSDSEIEVSVNFGKFWKCGFYDWKLMLLSEQGKLTTAILTEPPILHNFPLSKARACLDEEVLDISMLIAQGRFIVQPKGIRDETFHEVQVDLQVEQSNNANNRGTFDDLARAMQGYSDSGVSVLYLMGVFERDNCKVFGTASEVFSSSKGMMQREDAPVLAVTSRETPCEMLGGWPGFKSVMAQAKSHSVKVVVDCLARISSTRHHRKYRHLLLHHLDQEGRKNICYGTDGHAIKYQDTAMLNYRKAESWETLVSEVLTFAEETGVDGIHCDNGQAWPQIFEPDLTELMRMDVDGEPAYTPWERMDGEVVIRNENFGYWQTNAMETYANPFFVKLCTRLWNKFPNFMIVGECWGGFQFEHRQIILARSGVIPRLFKLPQTICAVLGKKLHRDGRVTQLAEKQSVAAIQSWNEESRLCVPEGSIMLQSSTSHTWPYPAYLFGKATWASVDILYFMPDIPITFNQEVDGVIYRLGQHCSVHQAELIDIKTGGIRRSSSMVRLVLDTNDDSENINPNQTLPRVRSGHNLAAMIVEQTQTKDELINKESQFKQEVGLHHGFDLSKIKSHYENRRYLRQQKMVLKYGEICMLSAHSTHQLSHVLAFARYSLMETAIIAINLQDHEQTFQIDLDKLKKLFSQTFSDNTVVVVQSLLPSKHQQTSQQSHYFLREYMSATHLQTLLPFSTSIQIVTVCPDDKATFQLALQNSVERTKKQLEQGLNIEGEQISLLLLDCIEHRQTDAAYFAGLVASIKEQFLEKAQLNFQDLVYKNQKLVTNPLLFANLLGLCHSVAKSDSVVRKDCKLLVQTNQLGPIVFCTPELGRWSTVGGLGVMVDELTLGLAKLGQEVIVISPYYDRNRQGRTGYLSNDPSGIYYVDNISIMLDTQITLGVHEGVVGNVKVVFLHHTDIFPMSYGDFNATMTIRQIAVFSKACLEYCCVRKLIPSVCVTNDWFTGFIPAYAKAGAFGTTFTGTTFMHICHNLMEDYEGRIYPDPRDGFLQHIHQLPKDWLVDPSWGKNMINPSRTAILCSDQWATVSYSYRDDLLNTSPLSPILRQKLHPFAHPNGIPIRERLKKQDAAAPDHLSAKLLIQQKYFNYQELDDSIPLFAFVGRITAQKGVHLILEIMEELILKYEYRVQFLIGGPANMREPYSANCAHRLRHLKAKYPHCVWAAPEEFFTDGALINRGADFGLMPSLFEPGGIVQHEFFVGGTPVIAFRTGGLKDSVVEFQWDTQIGCGFTFESHRREDFFHACQRAIGVYHVKAKYAKLRANAFDATMPGERVTKAWLAEFYRLRGKIYYDYDSFVSQCQQIQKWKEPKTINIFDQMFGAEINKLYGLDDIDLGAASEQKVPSRSPVSEFDRIQRERTYTTFKLHNRGPRHQTVHVCGSFDSWLKRHSMQFDPYTNQWFVTLMLAKGEHVYKYIVNGKDWVVNAEERQSKDKQGNVNNMLII